MVAPRTFAPTSSPSLPTFVPRRSLFGLFGLGSSSVTGKGGDVEEEYELLEELGSGRYGTVKRAKRKSDGSFFAVKTIPK